MELPDRNLNYGQPLLGQFKTLASLSRQNDFNRAGEELCRPSCDVNRKGTLLRRLRISVQRRGRRRLCRKRLNLGDPCFQVVDRWVAQQVWECLAAADL